MTASTTHPVSWLSGLHFYLATRSSVQKTSGKIGGKKKHLLKIYHLSMISNSLNSHIRFPSCMLQMLEDPSFCKTPGTDQDIFTHEIIWGKNKRNLGGGCWHCFLSLWELVWNSPKDVNFEGKFKSIRFFDHVYLSFSSKTLCVCIQSPSCVWLCNPVNCSTPALPDPHILLEFAQVHVHWISDAIQPSHILSSPSPPSLNPSQHQGLFQWVSCLHQ